jgi:hypothetical protein
VCVFGIHTYNCHHHHQKWKESFCTILLMLESSYSLFFLYLSIWFYNPHFYLCLAPHFVEYRAAATEWFECYTYTMVMEKAVEAKRASFFFFFFPVYVSVLLNEMCVKMRWRNAVWKYKASKQALSPNSQLNPLHEFLHYCSGDCFVCVDVCDFL